MEQNWSTARGRRINSTANLALEKIALSNYWFPVRRFITGWSGSGGELVCVSEGLKSCCCRPSCRFITGWSGSDGCPDWVVLRVCVTAAGVGPPLHHGLIRIGSRASTPIHGRWKRRIRIAPSTVLWTCRGRHVWIRKTVCRRETVQMFGSSLRPAESFHPSRAVRPSQCAAISR